MPRKLIAQKPLRSACAPDNSPNLDSELWKRKGANTLYIGVQAIGIKTNRASNTGEWQLYSKRDAAKRGSALSRQEKRPPGWVLRGSLYSSAVCYTEVATDGSP
jgi:hypothetical protein